MTWQVLAAALIALAIGYGWGKENGRREGEALERLLTPLAIRETALNSGVCPICHTVFGTEQDKNCQRGLSMVE